MNALILLQKKKPLDLICNVPYNSHVQPLARDLNILLLPDLYIFRYYINKYASTYSPHLIVSNFLIASIPL